MRLLDAVSSACGGNLVRKDCRVVKYSSSKSVNGRRQPPAFKENINGNRNTIIEVEVITLYFVVMSLLVEDLSFLMNETISHIILAAIMKTERETNILISILIE